MQTKEPLTESKKAETLTCLMYIINKSNEHCMTSEISKSTLGLCNCLINPKMLQEASCSEIQK